MTITRQTYTGDGSTVLFTFAFPYIQTTAVVVEVNSTVTPQDSASYPWSFANTNTIEFVTAPPAGITIVIYRDTEIDELAYVFYPGSSIRAKDLNENFEQVLHVAQESRVLIEDADAVIVAAIANQALSTANQAEFTANSISGTAQSALTTAQNAETAAQNAETTAQNAEITAQNAQTAALTTSNAANVTANQAAADAITANATAATALTTANEAKATAETLETPTGIISIFGGSTAPTGYLECNGQSTAGYSALAAIVGANVPDLRGEFVRGWDNGRGVDTGRNLLSTQTDEFKEHNHTVNNYGVLNVSPSGGSVAASQYRSGAIDTTAIGLEGGTETRPRNVALMYIIKT